MKANINIEEIVYNYKTEHISGFTSTEVLNIKKCFNFINEKKFNVALMGISCTRINNELIIYHQDVITALKCGIDGRNMYESEFD
jgi:hypothetical protein